MDKRSTLILRSFSLWGNTESGGKCGSRQLRAGGVVCGPRPGCVAYFSPHWIFDQLGYLPSTLLTLTSCDLSCGHTCGHMLTETFFVDSCSLPTPPYSRIPILVPASQSLRSCTREGRTSLSGLEVSFLDVARIEQRNRFTTPIPIILTRYYSV